MPCIGSHPSTFPAKWAFKTKKLEDPLASQAHLKVCGPHGKHSIMFGVMNLVSLKAPACSGPLNGGGVALKWSCKLLQPHTTPVFSYRGRCSGAIVLAGFVGVRRWA